MGKPSVPPLHQAGDELGGKGIHTLEEAAWLKLNWPHFWPGSSNQQSCRGLVYSLTIPQVRIWILLKPDFINPLQAFWRPITKLTWLEWNRLNWQSSQNRFVAWWRHWHIVTLMINSSSTKLLHPAQMVYFQDGWLYPTTREGTPTISPVMIQTSATLFFCFQVMICNVFVCNVWKAAGLFAEIGDQVFVASSNKFPFMICSNFSDQLWGNIC